MKSYLFIAAGIALALLGYRMIAPPEVPVPETSASAPTSAGAPATTSDAAEVFKKAFWKRPSADDRIRHAQRLEWSDADGVSKWQWFLALEPSPALIKHLREDNAFALAPGDVPSTHEGAPAWFAFDRGSVDVLRAPRGNMQLFFSKKKNLLYATDSGRGFTPSVPAPPISTPAAQNAAVATGRLPTTPPPTPERP